MKSACRAVFAAVAAVALAGCGGSQQALGTASSIIVLATDELWDAVGDSVLAALEPRIFTVRDERTFEVTHLSPEDPRWLEMRGFRQVLAIGAAGDAWVQPIVQRGDGADGIVRARDVWARNQFATALVLPATNAADAALPHLDRVGQVIDSVFRVYAVQRMYTSQPDTALRAELLRTSGFGILLPNVYQRMTRDPEVLLFQNSTQIGGDLVRSVLVTSRAGVEPVSADAALAWRDALAAEEYRPGQITRREQVASNPLPTGGVEVQGIWQGTDPSWPTGGPFITRVIPCAAQNVTYLVDAWLYTPSRAKYQYMIQLQTILNTFECADAAGS